MITDELSRVSCIYSNNRHAAGHGFKERVANVRQAGKGEEHIRRLHVVRYALLFDRPLKPYVCVHAQPFCLTLQILPFFPISDDNKNGLRFDS